MGYGIRALVWGDYALFTRPEMKAERVSYDVMTPSAARGLLEAIYWHPGLKWRIDRIHVLHPVQFTSVRRNEIAKKASASNLRTMMAGGQPDFISAHDSICQRASLLLRDVRYVIDAHFETEPGADEAKFYNIMLRRLRNGQCYHQPCLGCREFPAHFALYEEPGDPLTAYPEEESRDLGYMLYDIDYTDPQALAPLFFRARLTRGVLDLRDVRKEELRR
ncbi:MAG: type I-C CRISPR-associated protein Cas5c [Eubacteriales bacterium]|nr:type I-C CRISPR-associated protein Cas5c [Eubacteriales bacterium]